MLAWHRMRSGWKLERTALINRSRGLLAEFGVWLGRAADTLVRALPELARDERLPERMRPLLLQAYEQIRLLEQRIEECDREIHAHAKSNFAAQRISALSGIGPLTSSAVIEAKGSKHVTGARVAAIDVQAHKVTSPGETLECDLIATSGGYSPIVHLASHLGGRPVWREDILGFVPGDAPQKRECVGGINGVYALDDPMALGALQAIKAAGRDDLLGKVFGVNGNKEACEAIKNGEMGGTALQLSYLVGVYSVRAGWDVTHGRIVDDIISAPTVGLTKDNLAEWESQCW